MIKDVTPVDFNIELDRPAKVAYQDSIREESLTPAEIDIGDKITPVVKKNSAGSDGDGGQSSNQAKQSDAT